MSLELFINSGSIPEIDLSKIEGVRFEDVFSVASTTCATLKYNTGTFIYPTVTSPVVLSIPQTNYFMFDEDCSSDWDGTTPTAIRLNLKALGRLPETTNYQQKLFEIIRDRLVDSEITIKKLSTISELDPPSYKTFHISEASYLERVYDNTGEKFYAMEWGSNVLTETADFLGLFNYLPASSDAKDGFFTLVVTQTDTSAPELPAEDDELLICITPSKKYGFFEGVSGSFDSINITNVDITSASMESLLIDGTVNVTGSLIVNGDDLKVTVGRTKFGSLLINYDTDTSVDPGNNYFKYNTGPGESPNELALSMVIYDNGTFVKEAYNYEKTWTDIVDKKQYGSTITLKNLNSLDYKVLKINSAESENAPNGFIKFGVTEIEAGQDAFRLPRIDDEYSIDFDIKLETKTIEKTVFTQSGQYTVPVWAKTITVIAIGGGGGGGGGVGIIRDGNYVYGDSKDITELASYELKRPSLELNPIISDIDGYPIKDTYFEEIIGGGGGAGGNVVWKTFTTERLPPLTVCSVWVGTGGKGSRGGYGKIINRFFNDNGQNIYDGYNDGNKDIPDFKVQNSVKRVGPIVKSKNKFLTEYTELYTRGGEEIFIQDEVNLNDESYPTRKKYTTRLKNSGGDSIFEFESTNITSPIRVRVRAEGGFGGSSGYALPDKGLAQHSIKIYGLFFEGYYAAKGTIINTDNAPIPYPRYAYYADPGPTHTQDQRSGLFDGILFGGPGGHGISMAFVGGERFFNTAPNLPATILRANWGTQFIDKPSYVRQHDDSTRLLGNEKPSDYGPAGGGGGNGANIYIIKLREDYIINNPGSDVNSLPKLDDPYGYYPFGFTFEGTEVGKGGTSSQTYLKLSSLGTDIDLNYISDDALSDIPFGVGGNSGNGLTLPYKSLVPSLPTPGGLYGGGGGGGASLFFDSGYATSSAPDVDVVKGQDGADGGDGVVIVIAQN